MSQVVQSPSSLSAQPRPSGRRGMTFSYMKLQASLSPRLFSPHNMSINAPSAAPRPCSATGMDSVSLGPPRVQEAPAHLRELEATSGQSRDTCSPASDDRRGKGSLGNMD